MPRAVPGSRAQRIVVYGVTGSGKTTLAERISRVTGLPGHPVDELTWEPGWVPVAADEQRQRVEAICAGDRWVLDTAYGMWLDVPLARADLVVALDFPRWLSLLRLVRRTVARDLDGRTICNGNSESLRNTFSRDSIVLWHFRSFARKRRRIREWEASVEGPPVLRFARPAQADHWLASLRAGQRAAGSTSSTRTPPASFGCTKLTRLFDVPRRGSS